MGAAQSRAPVQQPLKVPQEPIQTRQPQQGDDDSNQPFPIPTGHEYDAIDKIASELPNVIDDESRQQVEDYRQACDNGKGPMVCTSSNDTYGRRPDHDLECVVWRA